MARIQDFLSKEGCEVPPMTSHTQFPVWIPDPSVLLPTILIGQPICPLDISSSVNHWPNYPLLTTQGQDQQTYQVAIIATPVANLLATMVIRLLARVTTMSTLVQVITQPAARRSRADSRRQHHTSPVANRHH
jgi:hypothetical protein